MSSIESLVTFVKELNDVSLEPLLTELEKNPKPFTVYVNLSEGQWEKYYGINGVHIYNHLHPQKDDAAATGAINEFIASGVKRLLDDSEKLPIRVREILAEDKELHAKFSTVSSSFLSGIFSELGVTPSITPTGVSPTFGTGIDADDSVFMWDASKEDSVSNRDLCSAFLTTHLLSAIDSPSNPLFFLYDVTGNGNLLNTNFGERGAKGSTDFVISSHNDPEFIIEGALVLFELHKPENTKNKINQAQLELLAGDKKSNYNIITVLTDLKDSWKILWFKRADRNLKGHVACLCSSSVSREVALGFLRYHLKVVGRMLKRGRLMVDLEDAGATRDSDDDEEEDEDDKPRRRKFLKTTPTYQAISVACIGSLMDPRYVEKAVSQMTSDELSDKLMWNWVDKYREEIGTISEHH